MPPLRPLVLLPVLGLLPALALLAPPRSARADCQLGVPMAGDVTCSGLDEDGFDAGATDDLDVTVEEGAIVNNDLDATAEGLDLGDLNEVVVESGGFVTVDGAGIDAILFGNDNDLTNAGSIAAGGDNAAAVRGGNDNTVTNDGLIEATGGSGIGLDLGDETGDDDPVTNNGTIRASGADGIGVRLGAGHELTNTGTITSTADGGSALVTTGGGNTLTNQDTISSSAPGMAMPGPTVTLSGDTFVNTSSGRVVAPENGVAIQGGAAADTVENAGRIFGDVDLGGGVDTLILDTGSSIQGDLTGGGDGDSLLLHQGTGDGLLDLDAVSGFQTITVDEGSVWAVSGATDVGGGSLTVQDGTLQLSGPTTLTGDYVQADGTTLGVLLDPDGPDGGLTVNGGNTASLGNGTTLELIPVGPVRRDTTLTVLSADGGIVGAGGAFANTPQDTALLRFRIVQTANQIDLQILRQSYAALGTTPNQRAVGGYLDRVLASMPTSDVDAALAQLDALPAASLPAAYDALHPEAYDAHTGLLVELGRLVSGIAAEPRLPCRSADEGGGARRPLRPCGERGISAWARVFVVDHERDAGDDWMRSDDTGQVLLGGLDWRPIRPVRVTGWIGLSSLDVDVQDVGEGDVDTVEVGLASEARWGGLRGRAALGYGRGDHEQDREIRFGNVDRTASSEFDSNRIQSLLEVGYEADVFGLRIQPEGGLVISHVIEDEVDESDAGDLGLEVDERSHTVVSTELGARMSFSVENSGVTGAGPRWTQGVWTPEVSAHWVGTWTGADREIDARLSGAPGVGSFTTEARDSEQGADVGARLTFQPRGATGAIAVGYDGFFGDGGTHHRAGVDLRIHF